MDILRRKNTDLDREVDQIYLSVAGNGVSPVGLGQI